MGPVAGRRAGLLLLLAAAVAAVGALWPAAGGDDLVVYSAMGPPGTMIPAFEAETGLRVTYFNMVGGPMQARLYAEGAAPRWTVAWFVGDAAMAALNGAGLLARGLPTPPGVTWTPAARRLVPADAAWLPTGLTLSGVFATRGTTAPADWPGLLTVDGGVGLVSPVTSGTAYPVLATMLAALGGAATGHRELERLAQRGLAVAATNPLLIARLRAGETALAILPSQAAFVLASRDPAIRVTVPRPAGLAPAAIAVSAGASPAAREKANRFIAFLLSTRGQRLIRQSTAEGFAWPAVEGADKLDALPALETLDLLHPDPALSGAEQGQEIGWFRRRIAP